MLVALLIVLLLIPLVLGGKVLLGAHDGFNGDEEDVAGGEAQG